jgi:hypothetical protein
MAYSYNPIPHHGDRDESDHELFRSIEFTESRQRSLWMSIAVHGVLLTALLLIPLIFTLQTAACAEAREAACCPSSS